MNDEEQVFSFKSLFVPFTTSKAIHFIILMGLIVYANLLFNSFVLEDKAEIVRNPSVHSMANIPSLFVGQIGGQETISYYRPILFTVYTIIYSFSQENPFFYHLIQILFQISNTILIYLIFKRFLKNSIAFPLALLFLVHPINEETVAWITNMQEVLYLFFGLLGVYLLQQKNLSYKLIIAANISLLLSFLSKETGVLFICFGLLYLFLFARTKLKFHAILSGVILLIYGLLRLASHTSLDKDPLVPIMKLSLVERMVNIPAIIFYYIKTFFFPKDLVIYHSWIINSIQFNTFYFPLIVDILFFILLFLLCFYSYKKHKEKKYVLFFGAWFVLGLAFHLQIFTLDFTVADHFFNFALIGLLALSGLFLQNITFHKTQKSIYIIILVLILSIFSIRTMVRNTNFVDEYTLLHHDVQVSPNDYLLELVYSTDLIQLNRIDEALPLIKNALVLYPQSSRAWSSLGVIDYEKGDIPHAKQAFLKAIAIDQYFGAYENLGLLYKEHDSPQNALQFLRKATQKYPNSERLWYYRFIISYKLGNYDEAFLSSKYYFLLKRDVESYNIYTHMLQKKPISIQ